MKQILILLCFFANILFSQNIKQEIADALKVVSYKTEIDVRILYTIASVESGFEPYIISFLSNDKKLIKSLKNGFYKSENFKININNYDSKRYIVSISSYDKEQMINLAQYLWDMDFNIDFGLMQISKQNLKKAEIKEIFDPTYNIAKSTQILYGCSRFYKDLKNTIECYNKGFSKKSKYNYYAKFDTNFNKFFGEVR